MNKNEDNNKSKVSGSQDFAIEKIVNQRIRNDKVEYYIKWKGHCESKNSWKQLDPLDFANVIQKFERKRNKKASKKASSPNAPKASNSNDKNCLASNGNGFQRGLKAIEICGVNYSDTGIIFQIQFEGNGEPELIPAKVANIKIPQMVIQYYESRITWDSDGDGEN